METAAAHVIITQPMKTTIHHKAVTPKRLETLIVHTAVTPQSKRPAAALAS